MDKTPVKKTNATVKAPCSCGYCRRPLAAGARVRLVKPKQGNKLASGWVSLTGSQPAIKCEDCLAKSVVR